MGIVSFSIPQQLVSALAKNCNISNFIETGTYKGDTSIWAATLFPRVYTIEIFEEFSKAAAARPDAGKNMEFLVGNSKSVLPGLVNRLQGRSLFWLDGHWCMNAGGKDEECPLMDELKALVSLQDSIILIDDARCFLGPLPPPHNASDWPRIDEIFAMVKTDFPNHHMTVIDDVIVICPSDAQVHVDKYWQDTYNQRYSHKYQLEKIPKTSIIKHLLGMN